MKRVDPPHIRPPGRGDVKYRLSALLNGRTTTEMDCITAIICHVMFGGQSLPIQAAIEHLATTARCGTRDVECVVDQLVFEGELVVHEDRIYWPFLRGTAG